VRVLVFTSLFPNNVWPYQGVFVMERVAHLARIPGVEARVIAPVPYYPPLPGWRGAYRRIAKREEIAGLRVEHARYAMVPKVGSRWHGVFLYRALRARIERLRREFPFDVIDAHYLYPDAYAAVRIGKDLGVPVVSSARGSDVNLIGRMPSLAPLVREVFLGSKRLVAVSAALAQAMRELGAHDVAVIPNGVDASTFHPMDRARARRDLDLSEDPVLLSVGNLVPNKGMDRLLRAVARASAESTSGDVSRATVLIVGRGPEEARLRRLATDLGLGARVRFAGVVPHESLASWYAAADLFCLATEREGWPNAVLESLACGTPVLATRVGGVPEILRSDRLGLMVEPGDEPFARALTDALARVWDRAEIARFGAGHTWEAAARAAYGVLESALDAAHPREARVAS
jgi:glycosyltransferase involved in cell wall biosynthesis